MAKRLPREAGGDVTDKSPPERKAFKDYFDEEAAARLGAQVKSAWPAFDVLAFCRRATTGLHTKEFNARVAAFSDALAATLPSEVSQALAILTRSLPPVLPDCEAITDGWLQWPLGQFIADHGLADVEASMEAMMALTMRFSSEFAVRPFLVACPEKIYPRLYELTGHENPHIRRWCSEGSRPRLPWGKALPAVVADPAPGWPILEALKDDPALYVRKSVANHLNDIAKDHPDQVITCCRSWLKKAPPERLWVIRHGLRSLIKAGHPEALKLLGYAPGVVLRAVVRAESERVVIGGAVHLSARVENPGGEACRAVVDYVLHFVRPSGKASRKVFKWSNIALPAGGGVELVKRHPFRHTTTRMLFPGPHRIELQVNGRCLAEIVVSVEV